MGFKKHIATNPQLYKTHRTDSGTHIADGGPTQHFDSHTSAPSHRIAFVMRKEGAMNDTTVPSSHKIPTTRGVSGNKDKGAEHV
jgi:hypothetical protein